MVDDILLNKAAIIERCLKRIDEEYTGHESALETDFTRQDAIVLNLQRACEASIDLAMHGLSQASARIAPGLARRIQASAAGQPD